MTPPAADEGSHEDSYTYETDPEEEEAAVEDKRKPLVRAPAENRGGSRRDTAEQPPLKRTKEEKRSEERPREEKRESRREEEEGGDPGIVNQRGDLRREKTRKRRYPKRNTNELGANTRDLDVLLKTPTRRSIEDCPVST